MGGSVKTSGSSFLGENQKLHTFFILCNGFNSLSYLLNTKGLAIAAPNIKLIDNHQVKNSLRIYSLGVIPNLGIMVGYLDIITLCLIKS